MASRRSSSTSGASGASGSGSEGNVPWDEQIIELREDIIELREEVGILRNLLNEQTETDWTPILTKVQEIQRGLLCGKFKEDWYDFLSGFQQSKVMQEAVLAGYRSFRNMHKINNGNVATYEDMLNEMQWIIEEIGEVDGRDDDISAFLDI